MKFSSIAGVAILLAVSTSTVTAQNPRSAKARNGFVITNVNLKNFEVVNNVLTADGTVEGTLAGLPFVADITNFALQQVPDNRATPAVECSVLNLELGPIHLALLGLFVDTSPICLEITATEGGGLLGDLLCGLAGGDSISGLPIIPTGGLLGDLLDSLTAILNGTLGRNPAPPAQGGGDGVCTGDLEILELVLGPLDLSLLGLNVSLDDCNGGPVQVCVSASAGVGILGDLLVGLLGGQLFNLDLADIVQLINRALDLNADGILSPREVRELASLLLRLIR